ncbi:hypothetical protein [Geodermatophilus sp. SYSU D00700]
MIVAFGILAVMIIGLEAEAPGKKSPGSWLMWMLAVFLAFLWIAWWRA